MEPQPLPVIYTLEDARQAGMTRGQLEQDGVRATRGAYVSQAVTLTVRTASLAALRVIPAGAVMSHLTAAALWGAPVEHAWPLHVSVPPGAYRPRRRRMKVHVRDLLHDDTTEHRDVALTSGPQTWLDLVSVLPPEELVAVGDALQRLGHLSPAALAARLARADGVRGVRRARQLAPLLNPKAASRPESLIRYWLLASDLPEPEVDVPVFDRWGREVVHADLGYSRWKVALEYEGRQHAAPEQFGRDIDRYSLMSADGWLTLRFAGRHLNGPWTVVDRTRRALLSRGAVW